jgi:hypothetical protein
MVRLVSLSAVSALSSETEAPCSLHSPVVLFHWPKINFLVESQDEAREADDPREADEAKGKAAAKSFAQSAPGSSMREADDARGGDSTGAVGDSLECAGPMERDEITLSGVTEDEDHSREVDDANGRDSTGSGVEREAS